MHTPETTAGMTAQEVIEMLGLEPHPEEGGFFRETHRSTELHRGEHLPARYGADRCHATAIYYLLTPETCSAMHKLATDEVFHHYLGGPVHMVQLREDGTGEVLTLGPNLAMGQRPQVVVPRGVWQGAWLAEGGAEGGAGSAFALLGCTVSPGFEFADYEHGDRARLLAGWPMFAHEITRLTK